jgi:hypothetical protein
MARIELKTAGAWLALSLASLQAAELPVKEVILFKHGVGFFARSGELKPGETAKLDFKISDMNDVLKSLTVDEKGGGKVTGLRYDSAQPLGQKLSEFPFEIRGQASLSAVLDQMKGARVEIKYGSDTITGQVVSGRESATQNDRPQKEQLILLLDSGEIRMFDLGATSGIKFLDPLLQRQFGDYLRAIAQSRAKEKRSLYIDSTGTGTRQLSVSYMTPAPVWKSSYRLIFQQSEPTLEGWAIVDNTTDEDWTNVTLAVVSGRPVSFVSELYGTKIRVRPVVELAEDKPVNPVVYASSMQAMAEAMPPPPAPASARAKSGARGQGPAAGIMGGVPSGMPGAPQYDSREVTDSTVAVSTQGRELGELFEYRFSTPVTVRKSESAMLPFLQQKLNSRKLLIYQESQGANPMNAAEISNSTGKTLDGGPITVYDAGIYAGEALMETLKAGDKRMISYAVDLGTRITTKIDSSRENVRSVTANRGLVTVKQAVQETKAYTIRNVDQKAKTLIIEHPLREGYKLLQPAKATETTATAYRFEVKLNPGATDTFVVREENIYDEYVTVSSMTPDAILVFVNGRNVTGAARQKLEQVVAKKREIADLERQTKAAESEREGLTRDQDRLRQNINTLRNVSGQEQLVSRYSRELSDQEVKIAGLRDQVRDLTVKKQIAERDLSVMIEQLTF